MELFGVSLSDRGFSLSDRGVYWFVTLLAKLKALARVFEALAARCLLHLLTSLVSRGRPARVSFDCKRPSAPGQ